MSRHVEAVTCCAWLPDGLRFVSGSLDKNIYMWNLDGDILHKWSGSRVTDLTVTPDATTLIAICHEKKMRLYQLHDKSESDLLQETDSVTSVSVSNDSRHILVNLSSQEIHLWDLQEKRIVQKYVGQKQGRFVIRSTFGGRHQTFILSGSEGKEIFF